MRSIESEGDTIDEAIENALRALEVERDRVAIEILSDATRGLLGFGGKKARVRATVRAPLATQLIDDPGDGDAVSRETDGAPDVKPPRARSAAPPDRRPAPPSSADDGLRAGSTPAIPLTPELETRCRELTSELLALIGVSCQVA